MKDPGDLTLPSESSSNGLPLSLDDLATHMSVKTKGTKGEVVCVQRAGGWEGISRSIMLCDMCCVERAFRQATRVTRGQVCHSRRRTAPNGLGSLYTTLTDFWKPVIDSVGAQPNRARTLGANFTKEAVAITAMQERLLPSPCPSRSCSAKIFGPESDLITGDVGWRVNVTSTKSIG